jgi:hypothetical protein
MISAKAEAIELQLFHPAKMIFAAFQSILLQDALDTSFFGLFSADRERLAGLDQRIKSERKTEKRKKHRKSIKFSKSQKIYFTN